jgi:hypothetical protein
MSRFWFEQKVGVTTIKEPRRALALVKTANNCKYTYVLLFKHHGNHEKTNISVGKLKF